MSNVSKSASVMKIGKIFGGITTDDDDSDDDDDNDDDDDDDDDVRSADRVQGTTGINSSLLTSSFHGNAGPTAEGEIPKGGKGSELISCGFCEL